MPETLDKPLPESIRDVEDGDTRSTKADIVLVEDPKTVQIMEEKIEFYKKDEMD